MKLELFFPAPVGTRLSGPMKVTDLRMSHVHALGLFAVLILNLCFQSPFSSWHSYPGFASGSDLKEELT